MKGRCGAVEVGERERRSGREERAGEEEVENLPPPKRTSSLRETPRPSEEEEAEHSVEHRARRGQGQCWGRAGEFSLRRTPRAEALPLVVSLFNTVCVCLSSHDVRTHLPTPRRPSSPRARSIMFSDRGGNGSKVSPRGANGSACCPENLQTECLAHSL